MPPPSPADQVQFLSRLQRLLHEGSFVASYKYALLLALADVCVEVGDDSGAAMVVTTRQLAERVVRYYWRQVAPYQPGARGVEGVLRQNTGRQAAIVTTVAAARARCDKLATLRRDAAAWDRLLRAVAATIEQMPLWKLQTVGGVTLEFLYANRGRGHAVTLKPGVAYCFRAFHALVEDLVRGAWLRFVRGLPANQGLLGQTVDLAGFMFGTERASLEAYRPILVAAQAGACFYCRRALRDDGAVDHFVPWSRYPVDLGHNFVLAHGACNGRKGDRLAAYDHLARWCARNDDAGAALAAAFEARGLVHDLATSRRITRWAYAQAAARGARVWRDDAERLVALDAALQALPGLVA